MNIPSDIRAALEKRERGALCRAIVKTLAVYAVAAVLLYVIATQEGSKFSPTAFPVAFYLIVAAVVVLPLLYHRIWHYFAPAERHGRVSRLKNCSSRVERTDKNIGYAHAAHDMISVDACEVSWQTEKGVPHSTTFVRPDRAAHARAYYQVGDRLTVLRCAAVPFNEDRLPPHPYCLGCGLVAKDHEVYCGVCGLALIQESREENEAFDSARADKEALDDMMNWWESRS